MLNPLVIRLPLYDPDRLLTRMASWFDGLFSRLGLATWVLLIVSGMLLAAMHWNELRSQPLSTLSEPRHLLLMLTLYPFIKLIHELAHGVAIKHWGGEVHQLGITLLVIMPVPYVDGNGANTFPNKWQRAAVAGAGVATELVIAVFALILWLNVEAGLLRDIAFSTMLIAGVSTLFFNGNPLMRFDAYYALADIIEIPDLWKRSRGFYTQLFKQQLARIDERETIAHDTREAAWLALYGALSWLYWLTILSGLVLLATDISLVAGMLLAVWGISTLFLLPLYKGLRFLFRHTSSSLKRLRATTMPIILACTAIVVLFLRPAAQYSTAQGVVWTPESTRILAEENCLVAEQLVAEGAPVKRGQVLLRCDSTELDASIVELQHKIRETRALLDSHLLEEPVKRYVAGDQLQSKYSELKNLQLHKRGLTIKAPYDGYFHTAMGNPLPGQYFRHGMDIGHVLQKDEITILAVVRQDEIGLFDNYLAVPTEVRLHENPKLTLTASALRISPGAVHQLPSPALALPNGGTIPVQGEGPDAMTTRDPVYLVEATIPSDGRNTRVGGRATLRFRHKAIPLGEQWLRSLRQLFLSRMVF